MSEKNLRHKVRDALKPAHVVQVENGMCEGTPDVYASFPGWRGWIELKFAHQVPKRFGTPVFKSINRGLETCQEVWAFRGWESSAGSTWILAQVSSEFYLVPGNLAFDFNSFTLEQFARHRIVLNLLRQALAKGYSESQFSPPFYDVDFTL